MQRNKDLAIAIDTLWNSNPGMDKIEIEIEMPLNSGLQIVATGVIKQKRIGVRVRNARMFYAALKNSTGGEAWNRMRIVVEGPQDYTVSQEFDENLKMETLEQVK